MHVGSTSGVPQWYVWHCVSLRAAGREIVQAGQDTVEPAQIEVTITTSPLVQPFLLPYLYTSPLLSSNPLPSSFSLPLSFTHCHSSPFCPSPRSFFPLLSSPLSPPHSPQTYPLLTSLLFSPWLPTHLLPHPLLEYSTWLTVTTISVLRLAQYSSCRDTSTVRAVGARGAVRQACSTSPFRVFMKIVLPDAKNISLQ